MNEVVIFGAGNIGRSFIGSIFSRGGWKITFIDANKQLVALLNKRGCYTIKVKQNGMNDEKIKITGVSALHSDDKEAVLNKLALCRLCSTSIGAGALKDVIPVIAHAVKLRLETSVPPLDVIIAENIRGGAEYFRSILREYGLTGKEVGLIETSIGKMVPLMTAADLVKDPLEIHAEKYNQLIVDAQGFLNGVPDIPDIQAVDNILAWVDRKLFIHNLGHAAAAYFGYKAFPDTSLIADVIRDDKVHKKVRQVMEEAAVALLAEYSADFTAEQLYEHMDDLLYRFGNRSLGDTIYRVGRDLYRKLGRFDRVLGAVALCLKHGLPCDSIIEVFHAALMFRSTDSMGQISEADRRFVETLETRGLSWIVDNELGLGEGDQKMKELLLNKTASDHNTTFF